jgi:hypothetical protein
MPRSEVATLAAKYIEEVLADQAALGYNAIVAPAVRQEAEKHVEQALAGLHARPIAA